MLSIEPPPDSKPLLEAMRAVGHGKYFGIALTSRHAVDALMGAAHELNLDARAFHGVKLACVGEKTAEALKQFGLRADIVPPANFNAESLVAEIVRHGLANGQSWLLPLADQARDTLAEGLAAAGALVQRVMAYRSVPVSALAPEIEAALERGLIDWVTVTSPSIARTLHQLLGKRAEGIKPLSFSPAISAALEELHWPAAGQTSESTEESILEFFSSPHFLSDTRNSD